MKTVTIFHRASGAFAGTVRAPDNADLSEHTSADFDLFDGEFDPGTHYVVAGSPLALAVRTPIMPLVSPADPVEGDSLTLSGLPNPCWVRHAGALREVTGGSLTGTAVAGVMSLELVGAYSGTVAVNVRSVGQASLDADSRWQAVREATPAQIDAWLTANVTDLASARQVLKFLILAVRRMEG